MRCTASSFLQPGAFLLLLLSAFRSDFALAREGYSSATDHPSGLVLQKRQPPPVSSDTSQASFSSSSSAGSDSSGRSVRSEDFGVTPMEQVPPRERAAHVQGLRDHIRHHRAERQEYDRIYHENTRS